MLTQWDVVGNGAVDIVVSTQRHNGGVSTVAPNVDLVGFSAGTRLISLGTATVSLLSSPVAY